MRVYKKLAAVVIILVMVCVFWIALNPSVLDGWVGGAPEYRDRITTSYFDMPVFFEEKVSEDLKQKIIEDITEVYQLYSEYIIDVKGSVVEYNVDGQVYESNRYFRGKGGKGSSGLHHPELLKKHFGRLISREGKDYLVVSSEVIDGYRDVEEIIMRNPEIIQELNKLVDDLNNMEEWSTNYDDLLTRFYRVGEAKRITDFLRDNPERFIEYRAQFEYIEPSLLFITDGSHLSEDSGGDVYITRILGLKDRSITARPPAIYVDGKWKWVLADAGT